MDIDETDMTLLLLLLLLLLVLVLVMTALPPPSRVRITGILCAVFASSRDGDEVGAEGVILVEDNRRVEEGEIIGILDTMDESVL